jgi:hypothetical protein
MRRPVSASARAQALESKKQSIHGETSAPNSVGSPSDMTWLRICCVQVVPDLDQVETTTSSSRNGKSSQRRESQITLRTSRAGNRRSRFPPSDTVIMLCLPLPAGRHPARRAPLSMRRLTPGLRRRERRELCSFLGRNAIENADASRGNRAAERVPSPLAGEGAEPLRPHCPINSYHVKLIANLDGRGR